MADNNDEKREQPMPFTEDDLAAAAASRMRAAEQQLAGYQRLERWAYGEPEPWEAEVQRLRDAGDEVGAQRIILDELARKVNGNE